MEKKLTPKFGSVQLFSLRNCSVIMKVLKLFIYPRYVTEHLDQVTEGTFL